MSRRCVPRVVALALAALCVPAAAPAPVGASEALTVATIAGPGFCVEGYGSADPSSGAVRSIAVEPSGTVWFGTGPSGRPALARVDGDGRARLVPLGVAGQHGLPLAPAPAGGVYVGVGSRIVAVSSDNAAAVVAGDPNPSVQGGEGAGDGGPAAAARFDAVVGLAGDGSGGLYVADQAPAAGGPRPVVRVRFVNRGDDAVVFYPGTSREVTVAAGHVDTVATVPEAGGVLAAAPGRLYVAGGARVSVLNLKGAPLAAHGVTVAAGERSTVAGGAGAGFGGDGGPARAASLSRVAGLAVDGSGNLLVADEGNHRIRRVDPDGMVTTVAGAGPVGPAGGGFNGNDRPATDARLDHPSGVAAGPGGRLYVADRQNRQVRVVDPSGVIRMGRGAEVGLTWDCAPDDGRPGGAVPATDGRLRSVAGDEAGDVYIAGEGLGRVLRRDRAGVVTTVPVEVERPTAVAVGRGRLLYIHDAGTRRLVVANLGRRARRAHGVAVPAGETRTVAAQVSTQLYPSVAADGRGNVFFTDRGPGGAGRVRRLDGKGVITTVVEGATGAEPARCCRAPGGLAVDPAGNLYVSDTSPADRRVWFVNLGTAATTVHGRSVAAGAGEAVAGTGTPGFGGDGGPAVEAELQTPVGLALDRAGNLYIADLSEHTVRRVDGRGVMSTVAGTGTPGFNGDGLKGPVTFLSSPVAVAVDRCDNLLVADHGNDRVRRLPLGGVCAAVPGGAGGGRVLLLAGGVAAGALGAGMVARGRRRSLTARTAAL